MDSTYIGEDGRVLARVGDTVAGPNVPAATILRIDASDGDNPALLTIGTRLALGSATTVVADEVDRVVRRADSAVCCVCGEPAAHWRGTAIVWPFCETHNAALD